jgi:hypothetical protein
MDLVGPELVAQVEFFERTNDGELRHASFRGCGKASRLHPLFAIRSLTNHGDRRRDAGPDVFCRDLSSLPCLKLEPSAASGICEHRM